MEYKTRNYSSPQIRQHFLELDGIRGILAVVVMVYHIGLNTLLSKLTNGFIDNGEWGLSVDFFFLLSGFVLFRSFYYRPMNLSEYSIKRVARLGPVMTIATLSMLLMLGISNWSNTTIAANFLMVHSAIGLQSINGPSWSIPFEFIIPGIILICASTLIKIPPKCLVVLFAISVTLSVYATFSLSSGSDLRGLRASSSLFTGALFFLVWSNFNLGFSIHSSKMTVAVFFFSLVIMAISGLSPWFTLMFIPLSILTIGIGTKAKGLFSLWPFQYLGKISFSVYLLHEPVLTAFQITIGDAALEGNISLKLLMVTLTLFLATISYYVVELPFINLGRKFCSH